MLKQSELSPRRVLRLAAPALTLVMTIAASPAWAAPIFSQATIDTSSNGATASDRDAVGNGQQSADDVVLGSSDVARSATWWGVFDHTPVTPVSFDLIFYADHDGLPDTGNILSSTSVLVSSFVDTGDDLLGSDIYVFNADLTPTPLTAGVKVWFSVLADTSNDPLDDTFLWRVDGSGDSAARYDLNDPFAVSLNNSPRFILDNGFVPEPTSLSLLALGSFAVAAGRRRREHRVSFTD